MMITQEDALFLIVMAFSLGIVITLSVMMIVQVLKADREYKQHIDELKKKYADALKGESDDKGRSD